MKRRQLLSAIGGGSVIGLAGCAGFLDDDVELLAVSVTNMSDDEQSIDVRIEHDGDVVEESTHDLGPDDGLALDCVWPRGPGQFVVAGRLEDDEEWDERGLTDVDSGCATVTVNVHTSGNLQLLVGDTCDPPGESC